MTRSPLDELSEALAELERAGLKREPPRSTSRANELCSNDYLGLSARLAPAVATGASASRLVAGDHPELRALELAIASWLEVEDALLFTSGYAANVGAIAALVGPGDLLVSDALNHASIIDGARLSRAAVAVVPHNDLEAVDQALSRQTGRRRWVAVESYFSMDADGPDLGALRRICDRHGAGLYVDEAHAIGTLGPSGRGLTAAAGVSADALVVPLGKAFGAQGALVCGPRVLRAWLWNRARSFVFSTGLSPAVAAAARGAFELIVSLEGDRLRASLALRAERLRRTLAEMGLQPLGHGHIVPVPLGSTAKAVAVAAALREAGLEVPPIRPPTVPEGSARLRLTVTTSQDEALLQRLVETLGSLAL